MKRIFSPLPNSFLPFFAPLAAPPPTRAVANLTDAKLFFLVVFHMQLFELPAATFATRSFYISYLQGTGYGQ
jgi:hypothetical protein